MKKVYSAPRMMSEQFLANQYVAVCYDLYCMVPCGGVNGTMKDFKGNTTFSRNVSFGGTTIVKDGLLHGKPCALFTSGADGGSVLYEHNEDGTIKTTVASGGITLLEGDVSTGAKATWKSSAGGATYTHYGYAVATDSSRPNHS